MLCSESQWERACGSDAAVGAVETWTASAEADRGFVARGGVGCGSRAVVAGASSGPQRAGACCSRAITIDSANHHPAFLQSVESKLLAYEAALNRKQASSLGALFDETVQLYAERKTRQAAVGVLEATLRKYPNLWVANDRCAITLDVAADTWTATCGTVTARAGEVAYVSSRYVWGGKTGRLMSLTEQDVMRRFSPP